jgi:hypothetical protein
MRSVEIQCLNRVGLVLASSDPRGFCSEEADAMQYAGHCMVV